MYTAEINEETFLLKNEAEKNNNKSKEDVKKQPKPQITALSAVECGCMKFVRPHICSVSLIDAY